MSKALKNVESFFVKQFDNLLEISQKEKKAASPNFSPGKRRIHSFDSFYCNVTQRLEREANALSKAALLYRTNPAKGSAIQTQVSLYPTKTAQ